MTDNPKPERVYKTHTFTAGLEWTGGRSWIIKGKESRTLAGGPPPQFNGSDSNWSPEDLMLSAVNSCHLASFIGYASRKDFEFVSYESEIEGLLEFDAPTFRFTKMILRPKLVVLKEENVELGRQYINRAHELCFMGHSVNAEITVEPEISVKD